MNLTIGSRSRRRVVIRVQVWGFWVRIVCRVRILGRFGRVGPDFGLTTQSPTLRPWLITRDCGEFGGPFGVPCAELRFDIGLSGWPSSQTHQSLLLSRPKIRNWTVTSHLKVGKFTKYHIDSKFCVDSESELSELGQDDKVGLCVVSPKSGPTRPDIRTWHKIMTQKSQTWPGLVPYGENETRWWNTFFLCFSFIMCLNWKCAHVVDQGNTVPRSALELFS